MKIEGEGASSIIDGKEVKLIKAKQLYRGDFEEDTLEIYLMNGYPTEH